MRKALEANYRPPIEAVGGGLWLNGDRERERGQAMSCIAEKIFPSGAWKITGVVEGEGDHYFLTRVYYGYTKRESVALWKAHLEEEGKR